MTKTSTDIIQLVLIAVFAGLLIAFVPLSVIWALNTLFPVLTIPYNFFSWLAVVVMNLTWMYKPQVKKD